MLSHETTVSRRERLVNKRRMDMVCGFEIWSSVEFFWYVKTKHRSKGFIADTWLCCVLCLELLRSAIPIAVSTVKIIHFPSNRKHKQHTLPLPRLWNPLGLHCPFRSAAPDFSELKASFAARIVYAGQSTSLGDARHSRGHWITSLVENSKCNQYWVARPNMPPCVTSQTLIPTVIFRGLTCHL